METETIGGKTVSKTYNQYEDFNVGDVVRLKSGGPNMTVDNATGSRIQCVWFETIGGGQICNGQDFDQATLDKVAPASDVAVA